MIDWKDSLADFDLKEIHVQLLERLQLDADSDEADWLYRELCTIYNTAFVLGKREQVHVLVQRLLELSRS